MAVGKNDMDVVKWALAHAVSTSSRIFFIHVSAPFTLIPTPGRNYNSYSFHFYYKYRYRERAQHQKNNVLGGTTP